VRLLDQIDFSQVIARSSQNICYRKEATRLPSNLEGSQVQDLLAYALASYCYLKGSEINRKRKTSKFILGPHSGYICILANRRSEAHGQLEKRRIGRRVMFHRRQ